MEWKAGDRHLQVRVRGPLIKAFKVWCLEHNTTLAEAVNGMLARVVKTQPEREEVCGE